MIIEEYDENLFISRFEDYKRVVTPENKNGNFSYKGLRALFQYLEDLYTEENPLKLDVISLCCDFAEYKNIEEYLRDFSAQHDEQNFNPINDETIKETNKDFKVRIEEEISNKTTLIKFEEDLNEGFIIQSY